MTLKSNLVAAEQRKDSTHEDYEGPTDKKLRAKMAYADLVFLVMLGFNSAHVSILIPILVVFMWTLLFNSCACTKSV